MRKSQEKGVLGTACQSGWITRGGVDSLNSTTEKKAKGGGALSSAEKMIKIKGVKGRSWRGTQVSFMDHRGWVGDLAVEEGSFCITIRGIRQVGESVG